MNRYQRLISSATPKQLLRLADILEALPEKHSKAFRLALSGQTQTQIAGILCLSQAEVSRTLSKTLEAIAEVNHNGKAQAASRQALGFAKLQQEISKPN